jgi:hypothetical protein
MNQKIVVPSDAEVRQQGTEALIQSLGIAKAAMFLRKTASQQVDYLELKEQLFGNLTVDELYREIQAERSSK